METPTASFPLEIQPNLKKPKLSTTAASDGEDCATATTTVADKKPRYKRRKVAIFFAYCGVGYQGMQKNPGAKTIEGDFEEALYLAGAVPEQDRGLPKRFDWARAARTDKGVSAVGQVVSGRFYIDPPGLIHRLRSNLSPQIRVFGFKRVTGSFSAKKFCDRRRYVYLLPVFALDSNSHRGSGLNSFESESKYVQCFDCVERDSNSFGAIGKQCFEEKSVSGVTFGCGISSNNETGLIKTGYLIIDDNDNSLKELGNGSDQNENDDVNCLDEGRKNEGESSGSTAFCYGEKERERFNRILKTYEGTHNFHNFTTRIKAEDPSSQRFIISFSANTTVTVDGIEFVKCEVVGQSFMLHQIRKLIGFAVVIMRNIAPESLIELALQKDANIAVPTAPEVGLYLDECFFTSYNKKWKESHGEVSMKEFEKEAEEFKMKHIYSHIALTEHKEGVVSLWLHSLYNLSYPDLCVDSKTSDVKSYDVEITTNTASSENKIGIDVKQFDGNNQGRICQGARGVTGPP